LAEELISRALNARTRRHPRVSSQSSEVVLSDNADRFAEAEHRDRSELVRFLIDWSVAQYDQAGSLRTLLTSKVFVPKK
jgi:hypothetical protein